MFSGFLLFFMLLFFFFFFTEVNPYQMNSFPCPVVYETSISWATSAEFYMDSTDNICYLNHFTMQMCFFGPLMVPNLN